VEKPKAAVPFAIPKDIERPVGGVKETIIKEIHYVQAPPVASTKEEVSRPQPPKSNACELELANFEKELLQKKALVIMEME